MTPEEKQQTIGRIIPVLMDELAQYGILDHCIEASALLMKVLHNTGIPDAYRLTVGVQIINEAAYRFIEANGYPETEESIKAFNDAGAATVVLGRDAPEVPEGRWRGHLAVIVPHAFGEKHAIIDPTTPQVNWPEFGIELPPMCLKVRDEFLEGKRPAFFAPFNTRIQYTAYPDDHSYNDHGDTMEKEGFDVAVSEVLKRLGSN